MVSFVEHKPCVVGDASFNGSHTPTTTSMPTTTTTTAAATTRIRTRTRTRTRIITTGRTTQKQGQVHAGIAGPADFARTIVLFTHQCWQIIPQNFGFVLFDSPNALRIPQSPLEPSTARAGGGSPNPAPSLPSRHPQSPLLEPSRARQERGGSPNARRIPQASRGRILKWARISQTRRMWVGCGVGGVGGVG